VHKKRIFALFGMDFVNENAGLFVGEKVDEISSDSKSGKE